jgi:hypothetical protein
MSRLRLSLRPGASFGLRYPAAGLSGADEQGSKLISVPRLREYLRSTKNGLHCAASAMTTNNRASHEIPNEHHQNPS